MLVKKSNFANFMCSPFQASIQVTLRSKVLGIVVRLSKSLSKCQLFTLFVIQIKLNLYKDIETGGYVDHVTAIEGTVARPVS